VGWWKFDGDANDVSGNGKNGSLNNFLGNPWSNGLLDDALSFNGFDDYLSIPGSETTGSAFDLTNAVSVTAWAKPSAVAVGGEWILAGKASYTFSTNYALTMAAIANGTTSAYFYGGYSGTGQGFCGLNGPGGVNTWHFVGGSRGSSGSNTQLHCQLDGQQGAVVNQRTLSSNNDPVKIGVGYSLGNPTYFPGSLDDLILYNKTLDSAGLCNAYLASCYSTDPSFGIDCDASCVGD